LLRKATTTHTQPCKGERRGFFENPAQNPEGEKLFSKHTMSEKSNKKQRTDAPENTHKTQIDAATRTLATMLRKPLLSLLSGAEHGDDRCELELDHWWILEGVSSVSAEKLQTSPNVSLRWLSSTPLVKSRAFEHEFIKIGCQ
jgi:hypothetical protein